MTLRSLDQFVKKVRDTSSSEFYRSHWGGSSTFDSLPFLSRTVFQQISLPSRRYKDVSGLVKIVRTDTEDFLSEWAFEDIAQESFGNVGARTLVAFSNPHETVEKGLWCYAQNSLPLVAESDIELTQRVAEECMVDSLVADMESYRALVPYLKTRTVPFKHISIVDTSFSVPELLDGVSFAEKTTAVLGLPETGGFASAAVGPELIFKPHAECIIETGEHTLLTKTRYLVTPIVRYKPNINLVEVDGGTFKIE